MTDDIRRALDAAQPKGPPALGFTSDDLVADGRRAVRRRKLGVAGGTALGIAALTASAVMLPAAFGGAGGAGRIDAAAGVDYGNYDLSGCPTTEDWLADNTGFTGGIDPLRDAEKYEPYDGQWPDGWPGVYPDGWPQMYDGDDRFDWPSADMTTDNTHEETMTSDLRESLAEHVPQLDFAGKSTMDQMGIPQMQRIQAHGVEYADPTFRGFGAFTESFDYADEQNPPDHTTGMEFQAEVLLPGNWLPIFDADEVESAIDLVFNLGDGYTLGGCWSGEVTEIPYLDDPTSEHTFDVDSEYNEQSGLNGELVFSSVTTATMVEGEGFDEFTVYEVGVVRDDNTGVRVHYACNPGPDPDWIDCPDMDIDDLIAVAVEMPEIPKEALHFDGVPG